MSLHRYLEANWGWRFQRAKTGPTRPKFETARHKTRRDMK